MPIPFGRLFRSPKDLDVRKILFATTCKLVPDQIFSRNHGRWNLTVDQAFIAIRPSLFETNPINPLENIDPIRW